MWISVNVSSSYLWHYLRDSRLNLRNYPKEPFRNSEQCLVQCKIQKTKTKNKYSEIVQFSAEAHTISIHYSYACMLFKITASQGYFQMLLDFQLYDIVESLPSAWLLYFYIHTYSPKQKSSTCWIVLSFLLREIASSFSRISFLQSSHSTLTSVFCLQRTIIKLHFVLC